MDHFYIPCILNYEAQNLFLYRNISIYKLSAFLLFSCRHDGEKPLRVVLYLFRSLSSFTGIITSIRQTPKWW